MLQKLPENQQFYKTRTQLPYFCSVELLPSSDPKVREIDNFYSNRKDLEKPKDRRKLSKTPEAIASCSINIQSKIVEDQLRDLISISYDVSDRRSLIYYQGFRRPDPFQNHATELDVVVVNGEQPKIFFELKTVFTQKEDCRKSLRVKLKQLRSIVLAIRQVMTSLLFILPIFHLGVPSLALGIF